MIALSEGSAESEADRLSGVFDASTRARLQYHKRALFALQYAACRIEQPIGLEEIAEVVGMSRCAFSRYFAAKVGLPFSQAVKALRVAEARSRIELSDLPLNIIAHRCGYANVSALSRAFKDVTGLSPRAYRRAYLERLGLKR